MGDKIPSERQEIWSKGLGQLYRPLQGWSSYIWSKMRVTDLCNSESVELLRQSVEPYVDAVGYQVLRFQEKRRRRPRPLLSRKSQPENDGEISCVSTAPAPYTGV
jgi:hypothetical protein